MYVHVSVVTEVMGAMTANQCLQQGHFPGVQSHVS